jgi:hypothetical protein
MWEVSFTPQLLYLPEGAPDTHRTRGWVGPRAGLVAVAKRKIPAPAGNQSPVVPARSLVTLLTKLFRKRRYISYETEQ